MTNEVALVTERLVAFGTLVGLFLLKSKNVGVALIAAKSKQYFMGLLYLFLNDTKMYGYLYLKL